ncbi:MAG: tyrosine-protein phosphatase [Bdellovibrionaceae bacterium]|nr:tyrosine-protein phosphatase [Pseudobdellovibrionaceae bacterium]
MKLFTVMLFLSFSALQSYAGVFLERVAHNPRVYRGRAPKPEEYKKLVKKGITTVIIFKNQNKTEVDDEIKGLQKIGFAPEKIHHIPLQWKDITSEKQACEQVVQALAIVNEVESSERDKVFFHCTVGEDRTGILAGLSSQLLGLRDQRMGYAKEMCRKGYSSGNPNKPADVSAQVEKYLTPLYLKISAMITNGQITRSNVNPEVCKNLPQLNAEAKLATCDVVQKNGI